MRARSGGVIRGDQLRSSSPVSTFFPSGGRDRGGVNTVSQSESVCISDEINDLAVDCVCVCVCVLLCVCV